MARANSGGWDFVKVDGIYQYKEDSFIAMVKVLEDSSTPSEYRFKVLIQKATEDPGNPEFNISHAKDPGGYWSGMMQIYETEEYMCKYRWVNELTVS
jgi:hypothetical protein